MQSLANILKVDRKALHYHVKNRQSLFQLLAHDAFSQRLSQSRVSEAGGWKDACRIYARDLAESAAALAELVDYLWFGDVTNTLTMQPVESLFKQLDEAGFTDTQAVRLTTMLATLCLGHARDLAQARKQADRTRKQLLKSVLREAKSRDFPNLERIASLDIDTYTAEQLDFSVELILEGAEKTLESQPKVASAAQR